jgi:hypothetical protein
MATTKTPVMGLNKPARGDFNWDVPLNENWDKLDKLGAGQLPLLSWIDVDYVLTGDAALGWAPQGSTLDGNTYTSLWTFMKAAYDRGTAKNEEHYGKTYSVRTDATTGLRFVTEAVYNQAFNDMGESLGHVVDTAGGAKKIILRKSWRTYDVPRDYGGYVGQVVDEQLPNIKGTIAGLLDPSKSTNGAFKVKDNDPNSSFGGDGSWNNSWRADFNASLVSSAYKDGAKVIPQSKYVLRYYKVGNTIVNQDQIDLGNLTKEIQALQTNKANTNLGNVDATGKANSILWGMPNYAAGISATLPYTAPKAGLLYLSLTTGEDSTKRYIQVNGRDIGFVMGRSSRSGGDSNCYIPLTKGDVVTNVNSCGVDRCIFYPFKGA